MNYPDRIIKIIIFSVGIVAIAFLANAYFAEPQLSTEYRYEVNTAECPELARLLDNSKDDYDSVGGKLEPVAYKIIRSEYMDRCNKELPLNVNYYPEQVMKFNEYRDKLIESGLDKTYSLPYDYLKNVDKFDNESSLGWCLNNHFSGYDEEKERCYWWGKKSINNNLVPVEIYVSEIESSYDLTKIAMADCYADGGGWDRECYYKVIDDRWCILPHELWSPTKSIDDATCYGDSQLIDLKEIKTI